MTRCRQLEGFDSSERPASTVRALQPPSSDPRHPQDWLPAQAYGEFVTAIGGASPVASVFHPFLHEIVAVEPADDPSTPPELVPQ